jgi:hypothetical protein
MNTPASASNFLLLSTGEAATAARNAIATATGAGTGAAAAHTAAFLNVSCCYQAGSGEWSMIMKDWCTYSIRILHQE